MAQSTKSDAVWHARFEHLQELVVATNQLAQSNNQTIKEVVIPVLEQVRMNANDMQAAKGALGMLKVAGVVVSALVTIALTVIGMMVAT